MSDSCSESLSEADYHGSGLLVTLELAKAHLRVFHTAEDELIEVYIDAASDAAQEYLQRDVYLTDQELQDAREESPPADGDAMLINGSIKAACLLIVGEMFKNRDAAAEIPQAARSLLNPYRCKLGV